MHNRQTLCCLPKCLGLAVGEGKVSLGGVSNRLPPAFPRAVGLKYIGPQDRRSTASPHPRTYSIALCSQLQLVVTPAFCS